MIQHICTGANGMRVHIKGLQQIDNRSYLIRS